MTDKKGRGEDPHRSPPLIAPLVRNTSGTTNIGHCARDHEPWQALPLAPAGTLPPLQRSSLVGPRLCSSVLRWISRNNLDQTVALCRLRCGAYLPTCYPLAAFPRPGRRYPSKHRSQAYRSEVAQDREPAAPGVLVPGLSHPEPVSWFSTQDSGFLVGSHGCGGHPFDR